MAKLVKESKSIDQTVQDLKELLEYQDRVLGTADKLLKTKKYSSISIPEGENKLDYINSLNNIQLVDDIIKDVEKQTKEYIKQKKEEENILKDETLEQELKDNPDKWYEVGIFRLYLKHRKLEPIHRQTKIPKYSLRQTLKEMKEWIKIKWIEYEK